MAETVTRPRRSFRRMIEQSSKNGWAKENVGVKKLDQRWGLLLVGVLLILAVVALVFLVFHQ
jgi:hypothetical protein